MKISTPTLNKKKFNTNITKEIKVDEIEDFVRLTKYNSTTVIEKIANNKTKVVITGFVDFGGVLPDWVQNIFIVDGPIKMIDAAKKRLKNGN
jgi:hypothetical protein